MVILANSSKYCTSKFNYNPEKKEFTAEASELCLVEQRPTPLRFSRLYNDACDVGITLVSHKTGNISQFYLDYEHVQGGDLKYMELRPTQETIYNFPALKGSRVTIFND